MRLGVEIVGRPFEFECGDAAFVVEARRRYRHFLSRRPGMRFEVTVVEKRFEPRWRVAPRIEMDGRRIRAWRPDFRSEFGPRGGTLAVHRVASAFDSFLRTLVSLVVRDGVLVHAACAERRLLPGRSGAGKSTFGATLGSHAILSDELTGLVRRRGRWSVWGTPFWGNFTPGIVNRGEPLEAIVFLDRRAERGVHPLPAAEALVRLLECVLCFRDDPEEARRVLDLCAGAVRAVPCLRLSYDARSTPREELRRMVRAAGGSAQ
ncbi:MAG: hypothetical protein HYY17_15335 [Planctomycetes bacterium]|nr:hypothetical protein [Planctomycetota bacterium]